MEGLSNFCGLLQREPLSQKTAQFLSPISADRDCGISLLVYRHKQGLIPGLQEGVEKIKISNPGSAIFMEERYD
jgi:hypothetical protein